MYKSARETAPTNDVLTQSCSPEIKAESAPGGLRIGLKMLADRLHHGAADLPFAVGTGVHHLRTAVQMADYTAHVSSSVA